MKKAVSVLIRLLERVIDPNGRNVQISWNILYLVDRLHIRAEKNDTYKCSLLANGTKVLPNYSSFEDKTQKKRKMTKKIRSE